MINEIKEDVYVEVLKVSAKSNPNSVAGAIAGIVRKDGGVEMQVIGAGALNQSIKAVAIAEDFLHRQELTWYADRRLWILKLKTKRKQRFGCYWRGSKCGTTYTRKRRTLLKKWKQH